MTYEFKPNNNLAKLKRVSISRLSDFESDSPQSLLHSQPHLPDDFENTLSSLFQEENQFFLGWEYALRLESKPGEASAREESIAWIRKVSYFYGFQPLTAYLSIYYLDRFLYTRPFMNTNGWAYQLMSVACLSLAAKMEEVAVPSLIDLQMGVVAKHVFKPKTVQRMELLVLSVLDWRLRLITPFNFLDFFAFKLDPTGRSCEFLAVQASDIILAAASEATVFQYRPSCIAAAALLCAASNVQDLSHVDSDTFESCCDGLSRVKITSCRKILQNFHLNMRQTIVTILPELPLSSSSNELSCSSPSPSKRRKLNNQMVA